MPSLRSALVRRGRGQEENIKQTHKDEEERQGQKQEDTPGATRSHKEGSREVHEGAQPANTIALHLLGAVNSARFAGLCHSNSRQQCGWRRARGLERVRDLEVKDQSTWPQGNAGNSVWWKEGQSFR